MLEESLPNPLKLVTKLQRSESQYFTRRAPLLGTLKERLGNGCPLP